MKAFLVTRRDLVKAISPNRTGIESSEWNPEELSRAEAREVIDAVFETMTEVLNRGEMVCLPFGTFEVLDHPRPPLRRWILKRFRVIYKRRKYIRFTPWYALDISVAPDEEEAQLDGEIQAS
jgi:nucleoid DNA-binding protein